MTRYILIIMLAIVGGAGALLAQSPGDLIVTEWMANPSAVGDDVGEYVEFFNTTDVSIDLDGFLLRDDGGDSTYISGTLLVGGGDFVVLGVTTDDNVNGGYDADYAYGDEFVLSNSGDEIVLETPGGTEICRINYTNGDPFGAGVSAELINCAFNSGGVTVEGDYVAATEVYGDGDSGSPGSAGNTDISNCDANSPPVITNITRNLFIPASGEDLVISADITDDSDVAIAQVQYLLNDGSTQIASMSLVSGDTYEGTIPASAYDDGDRLEYSVYAEDDDGEGSTSSAFKLFTGTTPLLTLHAVDADGVALYNGYDVRSSGVATVETGIFQTSNIDTYIQDESAGINIFAFGMDNTMTRGNNYTITGVVDQFSGKVEIIPGAPATDIIDDGAGTLPDPLVITIADLLLDAETYEGSLIKILQITPTGGGPDDWPNEGSSANIEISDDGGTSLLTLRIDSDTDVDGSMEPFWPVDMTGIMVQFDSSIPYDEGYQIIPRDLLDIGEGVTPEGPIISEVARTPKVPDADEDMTVSATITDEDGSVASAEVVYTVNDGAEQTAAMSDNGGDSWSGAVPASAYEAGDRVAVWIHATDNDGLEDESSVNNLFVGEMDISITHEVDADGVAIWDGYDVRATGTATVGTGNFSSSNVDVYVQNDNSGVNVFGFGIPDGFEIVRGNSYTVVGEIDQFNGKSEIIPGDIEMDITDNGAVGEVVPASSTFANFLANAEAMEGLLLVFGNVTLIDATAWPDSGSSASLDVTDDGGTTILTLRIDSDTDIDGSPVPDEPFELTGVLNQFDADIPFDEGYQIQPRSTADIIGGVGIDGEEPLTINRFQLYHNYPNPFNPSTTLKFDIPVSAAGSGDITLVVVNALGQKVATLVSKAMQTGRYTVQWDGRSDNGNGVPSGIYFAVLRMGGGYQQVVKMVLMK